MKDETRYLSLADVIAIHQFILAKMGSRPFPLRDEGLLESALLRAQMAAYYEDADVIRQSALLAVGIAQAQAFIDGNKRTAFGTADAFLRLNGWRHQGDYLDLARELEAVATRHDSLQDATARFEAWLRAHLERREGSNS
jgi:death-on-curing protein